MKNYIKYFFSRTEHWLITSILILVMFLAYVQSQDYASFIFIIPILAMIFRSIKMYNEKKNGTTS